MSSQPQDIIAAALHDVACNANPGHQDWLDCANSGPCADDASATLAALTSAGYALVKIDGPRDTTPDDPAVLHDRAIESARRILAGEGEVAVPAKALRTIFDHRASVSAKFLANERLRARLESR